MEKIKVHDKVFRKMIPYEEILKKVDAVAGKLNRDLKDCQEPPVFLGVLNGSFMFTAELMKKIEVPCEVMFIRLSSYDGLSSTGKVQQVLGLNRDITGRQVIVIEDIVESGSTIETLDRMLREKGAADVKICTLFFKPRCYRKQVPIDYPAMEIGDEFIVGFGLDYNQLGRQYKDIYVIDE